VLLISFNTWPIDLTFVAVVQVRQKVFSVATHGFTGCCGDVRRMDIEILHSTNEPGVMHQTPIAWQCRFRTSLFRHHDLMPS